MELFMTIFCGIGYAVIFVIIAAICMGVLGAANVADWIQDNELGIFIVSLIIISIISILVYYFILRDEKDKPSNNAITLISSLSISLCASYSVLFILNNLIEYLFGSDSWFQFAINVVLIVVWPLEALLYLLLIFGLPVLGIAICWEWATDTDSPVLKFIIGVIICAISIVCAFIIIRPAMIGDYSFYSGF